jgi:hypothetical protein
MFTLGLNYGAGLSNVADNNDAGDIDIKNKNMSAIAMFSF